MGRRSLAIIPLVISFGFLVFYGNVYAAVIANSYTSVDWSRFQASMSVNYSAQYSIPIAEAEENYIRAAQVRYNLDSWGDVNSVNSLVNTKGYGYTTADLMYAEGKAKADGVQTIESYGSSHVERGGYFTISESGQINFSVPYDFHQDLSLNPVLDAAYGYSFVNLWFAEHLDTTNYQRLASKQITFDHSNVNGIWDAAGILTLDSAVGIEPGKNYVFNIVTYSAAYAQTPGIAPIPEPATITLLGLGLVGLLFKKKKLA